MKKIIKSTTGYTQKTDVEYFGKPFQGFRCVPTLTTRKNRVYDMKIKLTVEVINVR